MHSNRHWCFRLDSVVDVFNLFFKGSRLRRLERELAIRKWRQFVLFQQVVLHDPVQVSFAHASVPIVDDVTALHDFSEEILEVLPWHLTTTHVVVSLTLQHQRTVA